MRFCRFNENRIGVVEGEIVADVTVAMDVLPPLRWPVPHGDHLFRHLDIVRDEIARVLPDAPRVALDSIRLGSPVANPSKVIAAPINYNKHLLEAASDPSIHHGSHQTVFPEGQAPVDRLGLFLKASSSVVGPGDGLALSKPERRNDHEVELAAIIGKECKDVSEDDALAVVAGYCIGLDMTVRGPEERSMRKSPDGYTILGPWLVTADELTNPSELAFGVDVSGKVRQRSNTKDLTVGIKRLVAIASAWYTLHPGDVLLTGTPEGVGPVATGDVMLAWCEQVGKMTVVVR